MTFQEKLQVYAKMTVELGVNVQPDKYACISCPIIAADFGRMVAQEAYRAGAKDVIMIWNDEQFSRLRYDSAPTDVFRTVPTWQAEQRNYYAREGCVFINIIAEDPEIFNGVDGEKLMAAAVSRKKALKEFYDIMDRGELRWTIVAYPNEAWAKKMFPNETPRRAMEKLWNAIFYSVRIGRGDAVKKWHRHDRQLKSRAKWLNREKLVALEYRNALGTNFTVGLPEGHIWKGGSERSADGMDYFPNMPTEELFTLPHKEQADGTVYASLPLSYQGNLIDGFWLRFEQGKVVEYHADRGEDALRRLLETDEGSLHLGEVALIPHASPISDLNLLFYNTLFDENASCHLALGSCYPDTLTGGEAMSEEELAAKGGNKSINHVDFMIGTSDMQITGIRADGSRVPVFENGNFVK